MKSYQSFKEIEEDLKRLHLERQIALEELKLSKHDLQDSISPYQWLSTALNAAKKYGIVYLIRRILK